jgi:PAS domain-containing protein
LSPWDHEFRVKFDDGTVRWLLGNAIPQREADGSTLWHGFITDITGRKLAEDALRESEARHRLLFDGSWDAMMTMAPPSWKFTSGNPAALKMFGARDTAEFTALGLFDVSPERQPDGSPSADKARETRWSCARGTAFSIGRTGGWTARFFPLPCWLTGCR